MSVSNGAVRGDEFDQWMGDSPGVVHRHANVVDAESIEVPAKKTGRAKAQESKGFLKKHPMLAFAGLAVVGVAVASLVVDKDEPGTNAAVSPEVAEVVAKANGMQVQPPTAPVTTSAGADVAQTAASPAPAASNTAAIAAQAQPVTPASPPASVATPPPVVAAAPPAVPAPASRPASAPKPAPVVAPPSSPAAADANQLDAERRITLLRQEVARANAARNRAEQAARAGGGKFTVVAVLNDGVVVRDAQGHERVIGVGQGVGR